MTYRGIDQVITNRYAHWVGSGFRVKQYFPAGQPDGF
ncbi:MAG TPA: pirin family protein, partial [Tissierellia bacterium]|nr:pirin family protein [Tissierellia bacterium]